MSSITWADFKPFNNGWNEATELPPWLKKSIR
jgi:hypothetical protein